MIVLGLKICQQSGMCSPEEDYRTFVAYLNEYIDSNPSFVEMFEDFVRILTYYSENLKLPPKIEEYSNEFRTTTMQTIIDTMTDLDIRDMRDFQAVIDLLSRSAVALANLIARDCEEAIYPFDRIFLRKNHTYYIATSPNTRGYAILCRGFSDLDGLKLLKNRIEDNESMPSLGQFYIYFKIVHKLELQSCFDDNLSKFINRSWTRLISYFKEMDNKTLRSADSNLLLLLAKTCFLMQVRSGGHDGACTTVLDFSIFCLESEFLEKQILGAKILESFVSIMNESQKSIFTTWLETHDVLGLVIPKKFKDEVLTKLLTPMRTIVVLRKPTKANLDGLWMRVQSAGSSETPYSKLLTLCLKTSDEKTELEFAETVFKEGDINTALLEFLQILVCSTDFDSVIDKIIDFLMSLIEDEKHKESVLVLIKDILYEKSVRDHVFQRCRKQLESLTVSESTVEILTYVLEGDSTAKIVDEELIDMICSSLEKCSSKKGLQRLLAVCLSTTKFALNEEQFTKFWESVDDAGFTALRAILRTRNLTAISDELLRKKVDEYDYSKAPPQFPVFLAWYIYAKGIAEGKIDSYGYKQTSVIPEGFYVKTLDIEPLKFLVRAVSTCTIPSTIKKACDTLLSILVLSRDTDETCKFLFDSFKDILVAPEHYEVKIHVANLIRQFIIWSETIVSAEDLHIKRHRPLIRHDCIHIFLEYDKQKEDVFVEPMSTVSTLVTRAAARFNLPWQSITLSMDGRSLGTQYTLRDYGVVEDITILVKCPSSDEQKALSYKVPTMIFADLGLIDILEEIAHDENASENKSVYASIRGLLKVLPSDQRIQKSVSSSEKAVKYIQDASCRLEQKYVLECIDMGLKENHECDQVIAHEVLERLKNGKIHDKSLSAAFSIVVMARLSDISEYAEFLVPFICKKLSSAHSRLMQLNSVLLLYQVAKADPELTGKLLLSPDSALNDVFLQFDAQTLSNLTHVFQILPAREAVFQFLQRFLSDIENTGLVQTFFSVIVDAVTDKCEVNDVVTSIISKFSDRKGPYFVGMCNLLYRIIAKQPQVMKDRLDFIDILVPRMLLEMDSHCQAGIVPILSEMLNHYPSIEENVCKYLLDEFSIEPWFWNFDPVTSERKSPYAGLKNYGITCYLNSVLQQLFADSSLRLALLKSESRGNWMTQLQELFVRMQLSLTPCLATKAFCSEFKFNGMTIASNHEQQDASEFYQAVVDQLGSELTASYKGKMVNIIEGIEEQYRTETLEEFCLMSVDVKGCRDLKSSLQAMIDDEQKFDSYKAESLGRNISVKRYVRIDTLPDNVVVHLKRFEYDLETWQRYKVVDRFEFPEEFDFAPYTAHQTSEEQMYNLTGVVVHMGTAESGHYYSLIKIDGKWFCFNDCSVTELSKKEFDYHVLGSASRATNPSAYMLFYTRNKRDYAIPNEKILEILPETLKKAIDSENNAYIHNQSVFTKAVAKLVTQKISSVKVRVLFLTNVLMHSKNYLAVESLVRDLSRRMNTKEAEWTAVYLCDHAESLISTFRFCKNDQILESIAGFIEWLVSKTPRSSDLITTMVENLQMIASSWENITYFVSPISAYLMRFEVPERIMAHWSRKIITFALGFFESENLSMKVYRTLALDEVFQCLCHIFEGIDEASFNLLLNYSTYILLSRSSMIGFTALLEKAFEAEMVTPAEVISILLHDPTFSSEVVNNMLFGMIYRADTDAALKKSLQFVVSSLPKYWETMLTGFFEVFPYDRLLRQKVATFARVLIIPPLLSPNPELRQLSEVACYRMFPTIHQTEEIKLAEEIYGEPILNLFDMRYDGETYSVEDRDSDADHVLSFAGELSFLCENVAKDIEKWCSRDESKLLFTSLLRVLRWISVEVPDSEPFIPGLLDLFHALSKSKWRGGGNMYECLTAITSLQNKGYTIFSTIKDFVELAFPIDFAWSQSLGWATLTEVYLIAKEKRVDLMMSDEYSKSLPDILECAVKVDKISLLAKWISNDCRRDESFAEFMTARLGSIVSDAGVSRDAACGAFYVFVCARGADAEIQKTGIKVLMQRIDDEVNAAESDGKDHVSESVMMLLAGEFKVQEGLAEALVPYTSTLRRLIEFPTKERWYGMAFVCELADASEPVRSFLYDSFMKTPPRLFDPNDDDAHINVTIRALFTLFWCASIGENSCELLKAAFQVAVGVCPDENYRFKFLNFVSRLFIQRGVTDEHRDLIEEWLLSLDCENL